MSCPTIDRTVFTIPVYLTEIRAATSETMSATLAQLACIQSITLVIFTDAAALSMASAACTVPIRRRTRQSSIKKCFFMAQSLKKFIELICHYKANKLQKVKKKSFQGGKCLSGSLKNHFPIHFINHFVS